MVEPLDALVGARIQSVAFVPETGLLALGVYGAGRERILGIGIGPRVVGVGWLPRAPALAAPSTHPLLAALRAHLVDHRVRSVILQDDALVVAAGGDGAVARVACVPGEMGEARVLSVAGETVVAWSSGKRSPFRPVEPPGDLDEAGSELLRASDALAAEAGRRRILEAVRAHTKRLVRRAEAVRGDLARLDDAPRLQRTGRMLLAQGDRIPRGATKAMLDDWEAGGVLEVTLDPSLPAKAQAARWFDKAKKLARGEAPMRARLEATGRALEAARALEAELTAADVVAPASIEAFTARAREVGALRRGAEPRTGASTTAARTKRPREPKRLPYVEYRGHRGRPILVGRGAKDNDALTLHVAKPSDLWLHARGVAGAHVVVPLARGASCPQDLLIDAAHLAAHHSDARGERRVEIAYAERRHVRKRKGAPAGEVLVEREKVLVLRVEPDRLARLLAARDDA